MSNCPFLGVFSHNNEIEDTLLRAKVLLVKTYGSNDRITCSTVPKLNWTTWILGHMAEDQDSFLVSSITNSTSLVVIRQLHKLYTVFIHINT